MRIQSEDRTRGVVLELAEQLSPDLHLSVDAHLGAFTGKTAVWVEREAFTDFLQALEALERTRQGSARLESISPGELELVIRSVDSVGHLVLQLSLADHPYVGDDRMEHRLRGGFALDPSRLPEVLADFQRLSRKP
ncbi:hypothetical protein HPC49_42935 [Pyxidicoccus fallax]|uniref:Uncharacterized protein n=1 Tax=Pyxidicoccus fallax TaxID=394095 RepID=A0A848LUY2_9BACT|nr:hypothetical protein [Pyxidicoccus fallax]NMO21441.1 hypothetical protein [Pyxidicoccus fallax]NPC84962.1 hypothetical protein [Pyxidicoccus fallax]